MVAGWRDPSSVNVRIEAGATAAMMPCRRGALRAYHGRMSFGSVDGEILAAAEAAAGGERRVGLRLHPGEGPLAERFAELAAAIERTSGGAVCRSEGGGSRPPEVPALTLTAAGAGVIHYLAAPAGPEAAPFAAALSWLAGGGPGPESGISEGAVELPTRLTVLMAAECPHCPHAVRAAVCLAAASSAVELAVVDVVLFPVLAARHAVTSVPATVIDDDLVLTGVHTPAALVEQLRRRGTPAHGVDVLEALADAGDLDRVAAHLTTAEGAAALAGAWAAAALERRMVLLLAARAALQQDVGALDPAVEGLLPLLEAREVAVRGDTADLLGDIGHPAAAAPLKHLLADSDPDVREAAADALEAIVHRRE